MSCCVTIVPKLTPSPLSPQVTPSDKQTSSLSTWITNFKTHLSTLPVRPVKPLHKQPWLRKSDLSLPLPPSLPDEPAAGELPFGFAPPVAVTEGGALAAGVLERGGVVDLLVEMPESCVQAADVVNAR